MTGRCSVAAQTPQGLRRTNQTQSSPNAGSYTCQRGRASPCVRWDVRSECTVMRARVLWR